MSGTRTRDVLVIGLTLVTGITDAIGFTKLGGVFTSVMTGNMVLLGISAAAKNGAIAIHTAVVFAGFIIGSLLGARIAHRKTPAGSLWPRPFAQALMVEFVAFAVFAIGWEASGQHPSDHLGLVLLGANAVALGIQSAAVLRLGVEGLSTTYLTGTLTQFVVKLTSGEMLRDLTGPATILTALIAGAALGAFAALHAPVFAPIVQEGILGVIILVGWWRFRAEHDAALGAAAVVDETRPEPG